MKLKAKVNKPRSDGLQTISEYLGNASIKRGTWNINEANKTISEYLGNQS